MPPDLLQPVEGIQGRRIAVTGAAGLVGYWVARIAAISGVQLCLGYHNKSLPTELSMFPSVKGDVSTPSYWDQLLEHKPDTIIHLAAQTSALKAHTQPLQDYKQNVLPLYLLSQTCQRLAYAPKILLASTSTVHGSQQTSALNATHRLAPITIYDLHKLAAEQMLQMQQANSFVSASALRLCNVYGPGPKSSNPDRGILDKMIFAALCGRTITIYRPGTMIRDYIFVCDVARAFLMGSAKFENLKGKPFVLGSGNGHTIHDAFNLVARIATELTGKPTNVAEIDPPANISTLASRDCIADISPFKLATDWEPHIQLCDGIRITAQHLLENLHAK